MTDLSICILTYDAQEYLRACLDSIREYPPKGKFEILVADNNSHDGTVLMLEEKYPEVQIIRNKDNLGFTKPNNQLLRQAKGEFMLVLNPDTKLIEDCFNPQIEYLKAHPDVGICIPKVLNGDGSFQKQSRRGEPRPLAVVGYFTGLGRMFPKSKALNGYLMSWLSEDEIAEVKAVSGSCMFIRRETLEDVGGFDEDFFAYQEDSDLCIRAGKLGWKVMYLPISSIVHYGGKGGSGVKPWKSIYEWHRSYYLFYKKHYAKDYFFLFNWFYYFLMFLKFLGALVGNLFKGR
jgi:GT2 family glycosyltransferase